LNETGTVSTLGFADSADGSIRTTIMGGSIPVDYHEYELACLEMELLSLLSGESL